MSGAVSDMKPLEKTVAFLNLFTGITLLIFILLLGRASFRSNASDNLPFVTLFSLICFFNLFIFYKILAAKEDRQYFLKFGVAFSFIPFLFFLFFFGYFWFKNFFVLTSSFLLFFLLLIIPFRLSRALGIGILLITLLVLGSTFSRVFEEDYCWEKANNLPEEMKLSQFEAQTESEKQFVAEGGGGTINGSFREHMRCHDEFKLLPALKETWKF